MTIDRVDYDAMDDANVTPKRRMSTYNIPDRGWAHA